MAGFCVPYAEDRAPQGDFAGQSHALAWCGPCSANAVVVWCQLLRSVTFHTRGRETRGAVPSHGLE